MGVLRRQRAPRFRHRQHIPLAHTIATFPFDKIEVDVGLVKVVRAGPKHGCKSLASALPYAIAELLGGSFVGEVDRRTVGESDAAQIECVGTTVLAELSARNAIT